MKTSYVCTYSVSVSVYHTLERRQKGLNTVYCRGLEMEFYQC